MAHANETRTDNPLWQLSATAIGMILLTCFAIASSFYLLHQQRLETMLARSIQLNDLLLSKPSQTAQLETHAALDELTQHAHMLLAIDDFLSLTLVNEQGEKLFEQGLPIEQKEFLPHFLSTSAWKHDQQMHLSRRWHSWQGQDTWLISTIDLTAYSLLHLQYLFISCIIGCCIIVFAYFFHKKIQRDISNPLNTLLTKLEDKNKSRELAPLHLASPGLLTPLIQRLNESIHIQVENEMELRKSIENSTMELRESLETVEIQNIDLDMSRKHAVEMNKLKSEFLKKTSKDLRTPLSGILGYSELLQKTQLTTEQRDYISIIEQSTRGLLTIVSDIHDFSRLESGNLQVEKKPTDVRRIIEETLLLQAPFAIEKEIKLYSHVDHLVPNKVLSDPLRIQQVLANLISNTLKFDHANFIEVCCKLSNHSDNTAQLIVRITTDGELPNELEQWQNTDTPTSKDIYSDARMGLSIAKGIAEHIHAHIHIADKENQHGFAVEIQVDITPNNPNQIKVIDPSYQINTLVFTNTELAYKEITSRLNELGINNLRARSFSDIVVIAKRLRDEATKHARYLPLAVIEAQTSPQTLDKILLAQTIKNLLEDFQIPTVVIAPMGQYDNVQKTLFDTDAFIAQHPLVTPRLRRGILDQLGIMRLSNDCGFNATQSTKPMNILLVEDNIANTKIACSMLESFNAHVRIASSGTEAIDVFQQERFDLVMMDIQLPDLDGFETTMRIRRLETTERRTPIVALTAHDLREDKTKLLLAGMDDFISKPLNQKSLSLIIDRWIIQANTKVRHSNVHRSVSQDDLKALSKPDSDTTSPVNISECLNLAKGDAELARDMLNMLIENLQQDQSTMQEASENKNYEQLYELVHRLHGACCYCGVPKLKQAVKTADEQLKNTRSCQSDNLDTMYERMDELKQWHDEHDLNALFSLSD